MGELCRERPHWREDSVGKSGEDFRDGPEDEEAGGGDWTEDGGKKWAGMEVDANEEESEDEEMARRVDKGKAGTVIFRGRMLEQK